MGYIEGMNPALSNSTPSTSLSLLEQANRGESLAWNRLVQIYGPIAYRWVRKTGLQPADCADVVQETFASLHRRLPTFAVGPSKSFRGWLWTITRNKAIDLIRKKQRSPKLVLLSEQAHLADLTVLESKLSADEPPTDSLGDLNAVIATALELIRRRSEPNTWLAFWRTVVEGESVDDVASQLGMNRWSVYKARSRTLQRLRSELKGLESLDDLESRDDVV